MAVAAEDAAEAEEAVLLGGLAVAAEGGLLGGPACVLLPVVHLLEEQRGFLLVDKGEASDAVLDLEGVEEGAVLVVGPRVEDLLVPYHASVGRLSCQLGRAE